MAIVRDLAYEDAPETTPASADPRATGTARTFNYGQVVTKRSPLDPTIDPDGTPPVFPNDNELVPGPGPFFLPPFRLRMFPGQNGGGNEDGYYIARPFGSIEPDAWYRGFRINGVYTSSGATWVRMQGNGQIFGLLVMRLIVGPEEIILSWSGAENAYTESSQASDRNAIRSLFQAFAASGEPLVCYIAPLVT